LLALSLCGKRPHQAFIIQKAEVSSIGNQVVTCVESIPVRNLIQCVLNALDELLRIAQPIKAVVR
jgi:hypothetical protein